LSTSPSSPWVIQVLRSAAAALHGSIKAGLMPGEGPALG
jgi:hypothetical protein